MILSELCSTIRPESTRPSLVATWNAWYSLRITPLGSTTAWPVYIDERVVGRRVSMGAGEHGLSAFVDADQLIAGLRATVADISDELQPRE